MNKRITVVIGLMSALMSVPALANVFTCQRPDAAGYVLHTYNDGTILLESQAISAKLHVGSLSTGTSKTVFFVGSAIPKNMDILEYVQVDVDDTILEGNTVGTIRVSNVPNSLGLEYTCKAIEN